MGVRDGVGEGCWFWGIKLVGLCSFRGWEWYFGGFKGLSHPEDDESSA